ncbi:hypothetical protein H634G_05679 [Metarhizium anisopliae BRIP 53293]|uniref:Transmembrane protein n=1 Tax=Metarhizium anisopliae BRIP 53293 TaxID=1291518 RepID=A0A0D9P203_METAN|nr:hypothetical protein H634G_05679 [Metarhizium anisopliae BRIP 53293]KJK86704.1 hypothetical protein H633G_09462 [Metarhizium anisopliae BRIP 53284]
MAKKEVRRGKLLEGWFTMVAGVGFGDFGQPQLETSSYALAALTAGGGIMGYVRTRSMPSIIAGTAVGVLYGLGGYRIQNQQPYGVELSLLASVVLGGSAIPRAIRLRKPVPVLLSVLSVFGLFTFGRAYQQKL